jgi:hypothetical protein
VSLGQWAALWVLLVVIAMAGADRLPRLSQRALAPVPLLVWIGWSLRGGTLTPLAFVIYAVPTVAAWGVGLGLGDGARFLARTVKRRRA